MTLIDEFQFFSENRLLKDGVKGLDPREETIQWL
tara:strand:+ start:44 stop:145 length:102 start_codon:yes stop_codon:yes gene_type:complete